MEKSEHIIKFGSKYYIGTTADYIRLSYRSGFDKTPTGCREATKDEIEAYASRCLLSQQSLLTNKGE